MSTISELFGKVNLLAKEVGARLKAEIKAREEGDKASSLAISDVKERVSELSKGENLLKYTSDPVTVKDYFVRSWDLTRPPKEGDDVVITIWGTPGKGRSFLAFNSGGWVELGGLQKIAEGVYQYRGKWTLVRPDGLNPATNTQLTIWQPPENSKEPSTIEKIKLEVGTEGTKWTPAPSDSFEVQKALSVGGRNLLYDSAREYLSNEYYTTYNLTEAPAVGEDVTVTLWGELGADRTGIGIYNTQGWSKVLDLTKIADGVYRGTGKWRLPMDGNRELKPNNTRINVYFFPNTGTSVNKINKIKLERGTVGTEWSIPPEELLNLQRGTGRNLLLGTAEGLSGEGESVYQNVTYAYTPNVPISSLTHLTLSCTINIKDIKEKATNGPFRVGAEIQFITNDGKESWFGVYRTSMDNFSGRISGTIAVPSNLKALPYNKVQVRGVGSGTWSVSDVKLEVGKIETPWSLAPEDITSPFLGCTNLLRNTESLTYPWRVSSKDSKTEADLRTPGTINLTCVTPDSWKQVIYELSDHESITAIRQSTSVTFSCYLKGNTGRTKVLVRKGLQDGSVGDHLVFKNVDLKGGEPEKRVVVSGVIDPENLRYLAVIVETYGEGIFSMSKPKLELGRTATAWSPHPEDVLAYKYIAGSGLSYDNFMETGKYFIAERTYTNAPTASFVYLEVSKFRSDRILQVARADNTSDGTFTRVYIGNRWTPWEKMTTNDASGLTTGILPDARLTGIYSNASIQTNGVDSVIGARNSNGSTSFGFTMHGAGYFCSTTPQRSPVTFQMLTLPVANRLIKVDVRGMAISSKPENNGHIDMTISMAREGTYCVVNSGLEIPVNMVSHNGKSGLQFVFSPQTEAKVVIELARIQVWGTNDKSQFAPWPLVDFPSSGSVMPVPIRSLGVRTKTYKGKFISNPTTVTIDPFITKVLGVDFAYTSGNKTLFDGVTTEFSGGSFKLTAPAKGEMIGKDFTLTVRY